MARPKPSTESWLRRTAKELTDDGWTVIAFQWPEATPDVDELDGIPATRGRDAVRINARVDSLRD